MSLSEIETFRIGLDAATLATVDALRLLILTVDPELEETIKWNAPSYAFCGQDRITLGLERKGGVRLVLHRGARVQNTQTFSFDDTDRLARWPAPDRGVMTFKDATDVALNATTLQSLLKRWLETNK